MGGKERRKMVGEAVREDGRLEKIKGGVLEKSGCEVKFSTSFSRSNYC